MTNEACEPTAEAPRRAPDYVLLAMLAAGFVLRLYLAAVTTYVWDEERDCLVTAEQISLEPGNVHLPLRGTRHPILPFYLIRASSEVFGKNPVGYRMFNILAGLLTAVVAYRLARESFGLAAGRFAAALLMFNEYHICISAWATDISFYLLFAALATRSFSGFLMTQRPAHLYLAGLYAGLAFMCKEIACLLMVVFGAYFVLSRQRHWLLRKEPYLATALFVVVIAPDLLSNVLGAESSVGWREHLSRVSSLGFNRHYLMFFGRDAVRLIYDLLGREFWDSADETAAMNVVFGALLLGSVLLATARLGGPGWPPTRDETKSPADGGQSVAELSGSARRTYPVARLLLLQFWLVLGFFMLIRPGQTRADIDPVVWFWVDLILLPAVVLTGRLLAELSGSAPRSARGAYPVVAAVALTAAVAWSLSAIYPGRLGAKDYGIGVCPEFLWPADGRMVDVRVYFHSAVLRDPDPKAELIRVLVATADGVLLPASESPDVQLPSRGADSRLLRLRAVKGQRYGLIYRVTDSCGRSLDLAKTVYVPTSPRQMWQAKFWVPKSSEKDM